MLVVSATGGNAGPPKTIPPGAPRTGKLASHGGKHLHRQRLIRFFIFSLERRLACEREDRMLIGRIKGVTGARPSIIQNEFSLRRILLFRRDHRCVR